MSGWVIGLGLAAGYLMNKNLHIKGQLEQSATEFNGASKEATDGVTSAEVRNTHKTRDFEVYGDMNTDLPKTQMDRIVQQQSSAAETVERFDSGPQPFRVQGVMMQYDRLGV